MDNDIVTTKSSVMGGVWISEVEKIKRTSNIDIDIYDIEYSDENRKRVYCIK